MNCFFGGLFITVLQLLSLTKRFFIQILIIHDNISLQVHDKKVGFYPIDEPFHYP